MARRNGRARECLAIGGRRDSFEKRDCGLGVLRRVARSWRRFAGLAAEHAVAAPSGKVKAFTQEGIASYYSHRSRNASGGWSNPGSLTAAHRHLPIGSRVLVTHLKSGRTVIVTINDRGPFRKRPHHRPVAPERRKSWESRASSADRRHPVRPGPKPQVAGAPDVLPLRWRHAAANGAIGADRFSHAGWLMAPPLLQLTDIALTFGGTPLLDGAELSVSAGERLCLVGRNGSGKSTLLKIAAGLMEADRGTVFLQPSATIRYLPQEPDLSQYATTLRLCARRARTGR